MLALFLSLSLAFAGNEFDPNNQEHLEQTGKLFTVKIVPGSKQTTLWITGIKAAEIQFNKLNVEAFLTTPYGEKKLQLTRQKDHFTTPQSIQGQELKLKLQGEKPSEVESLNIKLKKQ